MSYVFGTKLITNRSSRSNQQQEMPSISNEDLTFFEDFSVNFMNECKKSSRTIYKISETEEEELRLLAKQNILRNPQFLSIVKQRVLGPKSSLESILNSDHISLVNIPGVRFFESSFYAAKFKVFTKLPTSIAECLENSIFNLESVWEEYDEFYALTQDISALEDEHASDQYNDYIDYNNAVTELNVMAHILKNKNSEIVELCLDKNVWLYHGKIGRFRFRDFWDYFGNSDQFSLQLSESSELMIELLDCKIKKSIEKYSTSEIEATTIEATASTQSSITRQVQPERSQEAMIALPSQTTAPSAPSGNSGPPGSWLWLVALTLPLPFIVVAKFKSFFQKSPKSPKKIKISKNVQNQDKLSIIELNSKSDDEDCKFSK